MSGRVVKTIDPFKGFLPLENNAPYTISNKNNVKGCYSIGYDWDLDKSPESFVLTKIGYGGGSLKEGGLIRRIDSYHTCYPESPWVYCIILCNTADLSRAVEKEIHKFLDGRQKRYKSQWKSRIRKHEWFYCKIQDIREAFLNSGVLHPTETKVVFMSSDVKESKVLVKMINEHKRKYGNQ